MKKSVTSQQQRQSSSPPRTHGTPSGYRNLRVLVTTALHYRLLALAGLSQLSLPELVVRTLDRATPFDPLTGEPVPTDGLARAPGLEPGQDAHASHGPGSPPGATNLNQCATPRPVAIPGPSGETPPAEGPGNAHTQGACASLAPDPGTDHFLIQSSPTVSPNRPGPGQGQANAEAKGHE
ncbi:hypothetical protein SAMN05444166_7335 [Singulisphaera sp. GP187]|uniref:hypothetical protein n=1 Tax=Singulisphaera sp. GP187 TaxID=1882752 RepID=UPI00092A6250|nr:hypothetical protein [Singulisphaera sp. GP187]SIO63399.1 hypothetical protein SAMN05444166_7335 [Singulisphaera sp. GP187]